MLKEELCKNIVVPWEFVALARYMYINCGLGLKIVVIRSCMYAITAKDTCMHVKERW